MTDRVDSPGNVDDLTENQLGKGYNIVDHGDEPNVKAEFWSPSMQMWVDRITPKAPYDPKVTYRVPTGESDHKRTGV